MKTLIVLLLLITPAVFAETQTQGDWSYQSTNNDDGLTLVTKTVSDSGAILGIMCASSLDGCYAFFNPVTTSCKAEGKFVILINADSGADAVTATCYAINESRVFFFDIEERNKMKTNNTIGIAVPMGSGKFKAYYFSLQGSSAMINLLETKWVEHNKKPTQYEDGTI